MVEHVLNIQNWINIPDRSSDQNESSADDQSSDENESSAGDQNVVDGDQSSDENVSSVVVGDQSSDGERRLDGWQDIQFLPHSPAWSTDAAQRTSLVMDEDFIYCTDEEE